MDALKSRIRFDLRKKLSSLFTIVLLVNAIIIIGFSLGWGFYQAREDFFKSATAILNEQASYIAECHQEGRWRHDNLGDSRRGILKALRANTAVGFIRIYMPNGTCRVEVLQNGPDFTAAEFTRDLNIDRLCSSIRNGKRFDFDEWSRLNRLRSKSVVWLDCFLNIPDYYDRWVPDHRQLVTDDIDRLARETEHKRLIPLDEFFSLPVDVQRKIRTLNRLIFQATHESRCPVWQGGEYEPPPVLSLADLKRKVNLDGKSLTSTVIPVIGNHYLDPPRTTVAYLEIGYDEKHFYTQLLQRTLPSHAGLVVVLLIVSLLLTYVLASRLSRPLREVIQVTDGIAAGGQFRPVETTSSDEAGVIAEIFNDVYRRMQERIEHLSRLQERTIEVGSQLELAPLYRVILEVFMRETGATRAAVLGIDQKENNLMAHVCHPETSTGKSPAQASLAGAAIASRELKQAGDEVARRETALWWGEAAAGETGTALALAIPLCIRDQAHGAVVLTGFPERYGGRLDREEALYLTNLAGAAGSALENARLYEKTQQLFEASQRLRRIFETYVSSALVDRVLKTESADGFIKAEAAKVTILFADFRGFTTFSAQAEPAAVLDMLNDYFPRLLRVIESQDGVVDKLIGDAIMAHFSSPLKPLADHVKRSVQVALAMLKEVDTINRTRRDAGKPCLEMGIGIATGPVVAGSVGARERKEYTVIGSEVNLASRLCGQAGPGELVISDWVFQELGKGQNAAEELPALNVKGIASPVRAYRVKRQS